MPKVRKRGSTAGHVKSYRLSPEVIDGLVAMARNTNRSQNNLVETVLRNAVREHRRKTAADANITPCLNNLGPIGE